ncbi:hypothetical protein ACOSQ2_004166 [Xanthoceras sorbifolium]
MVSRFLKFFLEDDDILKEREDDENLVRRSTRHRVRREEVKLLEEEKLYCRNLGCDLPSSDPSSGTYWTKNCLMLQGGTILFNLGRIKCFTNPMHSTNKGLDTFLSNPRQQICLKC